MHSPVLSTLSWCAISDRRDRCTEAVWHLGEHGSVVASLFVRDKTAQVDRTKRVCERIAQIGCNKRGCEIQNALLGCNKPACEIKFHSSVIPSVCKG